MREHPVDLEDALKTKGTILAVQDNSSRTSLPNGVRKWTKLEVLSLPHFEGKRLPEWMGEFSNLKSLSVGGALETIEPWLAKLTALEDLEIVAPEDGDLAPIGRLSRLRRLHLWGRTRDGKGVGLPDVPKAFERLKSLVALRFENTGLRDVPAFVGKLPALTELEFHGASFGVLGWSLGTARQLTRLVLRDTLIEALPEEIGNLTSLSELDIGQSRSYSWNKVPPGRLERLPASLGRLRGLEDLSIGRNPIRELPESVLSLERLKFLSITDGSAMLALPARLLELPALEVVNFTGTRLSESTLSALQAYAKRTKVSVSLPKSKIGGSSKAEETGGLTARKAAARVKGKSPGKASLIGRFEAALEKARPGFIERSMKKGATEKALAKFESKRAPSCLRISGNSIPGAAMCARTSHSFSASPCSA